MSHLGGWEEEAATVRRVGLLKRRLRVTKTSDELPVELESKKSTGSFNTRNLTGTIRCSL